MADGLQVYCIDCKREMPRYSDDKRRSKKLCHCRMRLLPSGRCPVPGCSPYSDPHYLRMLDQRMEENERRPVLERSEVMEISKQVTQAFRKLAMKYDPFYRANAAKARRGGLNKHHLTVARKNKAT